MKTKISAALLVITLALGAFAQATPEALTEVEHLKLQLAIERSSRIQAQYELGLAEVVREYRERRATRDLIEAASAAALEVNKVVDAAFEAHQVSKANFRLDASTGTFVPVTEK